MLFKYKIDQTMGAPLNKDISPLCEKNMSSSLLVVYFSYIWRHLDIGYVQGMCDLLAPLLVILDDGESFPSSSRIGIFFSQY